MINKRQEKMNSHIQGGGEKKKIAEVKTIPVTFALGEKQGDITVHTNNPSKPSKEQIINQAFKFHSEGNIQEAAKYYKFFIDQGYKDHRVFSNYGNILKDLGNLKDAELSYQKAIGIKPDYAEAYSNLGNILKALGNSQEAELSYRKAIEIKPNFAEAHSNLGAILRDYGKSKDAELSYRKAIEINPDLAEAHANLGIILRDLDKLHEAELSTRKAIKINPNYAEAYSNLGIILSDLRKSKDAELSTRKAIKINPNYAEAHSNLGIILKGIGKLKEAELSTRKAIEINPYLKDAYLNLGGILMDLGKLKEAEFLYRKVIELKPDFVQAYYSLSIIKDSDKNKIWRDQLFSDSILNNKSQKDLVDIYFARANILHKEKNYADSAKFLKLANQLKLILNPSKADSLINQSKVLLIESDKLEINQKDCTKSPESIFIVGMPRCGSTLLESILTMRKDIYDLGEINILEESLLECMKCKKDINLAKIYREKINDKTKFNITTNKWLYNYQYAGIIAKNIPNAKIIHCYRNPLDNILSIYRAHFAKGNKYASSLVDCTRVYLDQEDLMTKYKNIFRSKIYDLNYDSLVNNPREEIKSLISWLGWEWQDSFLTPHLNPRSVSTRSNIEVRSPINSRSVGGWKNYKDMLKPAIEILTQTDKYKKITL